MTYKTKRLKIKQILLTNNSWWNFFEKYKKILRKDVIIAITKLLSCKNKIRGFHEYSCLTPGCSHIKHVLFTCKSKACSSCGKKSTELWINKQYEVLPDTSYVHITFTMPSQLWEFFWSNRWWKCIFIVIHINVCYYLIQEQQMVITYEWNTADNIKNYC